MQSLHHVRYYINYSGYRIERILDTGNGRYIPFYVAFTRLYSILISSSTSTRLRSTWLSSARVWSTRLPSARIRAASAGIRPAGLPSAWLCPATRWCPSTSRYYFLTLRLFFYTQLSRATAPRPPSRFSMISSSF